MGSYTFDQRVARSSTAYQGAKEEITKTYPQNKLNRLLSVDDHTFEAQFDIGQGATLGRAQIRLTPEGKIDSVTIDTFTIKKD